MRGRTALLAILISLPATAGAEICSGEYQPGERRLTREQRAQEAERLRQEREQAEAREREREAQAEQARREAQARLAARPLGERLVEARCNVCHGPDALREHRYGWLGWWAVLLRMELVNGARFDAGERSAIVSHLAATQAGSTLRRTTEWTLAVGLPVLLLAVARVLLRRRR